ncbi:MAG TPA: alpha/beta fold hydrolase [Chloroflexota bacterium]|jgi:hypothetical protein
MPDLPQFGKSDSPVLTEDRPLANARLLAAFFDAVGVERASLVGNSMGGATALELAIHYPERVDKLVLMGSGGAGPSLFGMVPTEGDRLLRENFQNPTLDSMRRLIQVMVHDASFLTDEIVQQRLESALNPAHREARRKSFRKPGEPRADLEKVQAPTLIVWGREDRVNPFDQALRPAPGHPRRAASRLHRVRPLGAVRKGRRLQPAGDRFHRPLKLEQMARRAPKPDRRERAPALLKVAAGQPAAVVARSGLLRPRDPDMVYSGLDRYEQDGLAGLTIAPGRGRKPVFF